MAAMELFSCKGFDQTTVEEITRAADVGKGTFFNYFPTKEHVLGYLIGKQKGAVLHHRLLAQDGTVASEVVLVSLGRSLLKFPGKSPQMARSLASAFLGNSEARDNIVGEMSVGRKWIAEIIRLGQERGELNDHLPPATLARPPCSRRAAYIPASKSGTTKVASRCVQRQRGAKISRSHTGSTRPPAMEKRRFRSGMSLAFCEVVVHLDTI